MKNKLNFYHIIEALVGDVAIGGSIALMAQNDPSVSADYKPGDIDLCISSEEDLQTIHEALIADGYTVSLDIPSPYMFTVRRQYKKDGEKHDFFIVPGLSKLMSCIDGIFYTHVSIVWAARGFYAGVGSAKAHGQLVGAGLITDNPKPAMRTRSLIKKIVKNIKYLISC